MSYIYGVFAGDKSLYIGQTKRDPVERFKEHKRDIKNKRHKIKKLNTYCCVEDLDFRVLLELETDNTLLLFISECCYNSIYKPLNRCVLQGFGGSVTVQRCEKEIAEKLLEVIR